MKILLVTGGNGPERKISFMSAHAVRSALRLHKHRVEMFDLRKGVGKLRRIIRNHDLIFPIIHGEEGEGGKLQKFFTKLSVPFIGGDHWGYKHGWYKIPFKKFCKQEHIPTPKWIRIKEEADIVRFGFPCVLKASAGGSSKEVVVLSTLRELRSRASLKLLNSNLVLLVEQYLPGVEVTVGILGGKALPIMEITPPKGEWFNYQNKYNGASRETPHAPSLSGELRKLTQEIALKIHQSFNFGHFSRTDFIIHDNTPYALEVNTIPGLTPQSLFPKAAQAAGLSFNEMVEQIVGVHT